MAFTQKYPTRNKLTATNRLDGIAICLAVLVGSCIYGTTPSANGQEFNSVAEKRQSTQACYKYAFFLNHE